MDLWQLHIFCKVVEFKSFSGAGKTVHLSQPTVSSHIKDLENHFGCRLIDRMAREAIPTRAGELLYGYARKLIALRDETEIAMAEFHGKIKGCLTIGGSTIPGTYILPRLVGAFIGKYPDVTLSLTIGDTERITGDILSGQLELGIVGAKTRDKKILQEALIADEMFLVVPADHPWAKRKSVTPDMLLKEPFIIREAGSGTLKSIQENLEKSGCDIDDLNVIAEMGSTGAVIQGIRNRVGISILSGIAVAEEAAAGTLTALSVEGLSLKRHFYLSVHRHKTASPLCNTFVRFLKQQLTPPE
ncbi:LysR family transcriptional regulator [Desulfonema ishimotonii]|uniref:LysR family transcriptional regulator n=1 Tax=Desulfonema ishimotonii TaxID=45657 RepID=A0A401G0Z7_9BACT|nr:selenium metabolism-associated LysR family transcriptional regulator [Desulfonema ishimotonii]GBC62899.1 LysR family transcriptional regulator [Desulfonema ishimotonii]